MKRTIFVMFVSAIINLSAFAQRLSYSTIAVCSRDMKTQNFGKVHPINITIERDGNSDVTIDGCEYKVLKIDHRNDTDSIQSIQYTVADPHGKEYVIKFTHNDKNKVELMRYQMIIFDTSKPFDWTYYFANPPKVLDAILR